MTPSRLAFVALLALGLAACDTSTTPASPFTERGPSRDAFSGAALLTAEQAEEMALLPTASKMGGSSDRVLVPLVFDEAGRLHSPESFNAEQVRGLLRGEQAQAASEMRFTDLATFQRVLGASGKSALYASGKRVRIGGVEAFDPYTLTPKQIEQVRVAEGMTMGSMEECDPLAIQCEGGGGGEPTDPNANLPPRPTSDVAPTYASTPTWPLLWRGDVISGEGDCGSSSGQSCGSSSTGFSNFGHSFIITQLANSANPSQLDPGKYYGGDLLDDSTLSMEAQGDKPNVEDEVLQRTAKTWLTERPLRYAHVMYKRNTYWYQRLHAISFAREQDPDPYDVTTLKTREDAWYCSKLVWRSYLVATGDDLDPDWGFFVTPHDLENSGHLITLYHYRRPDVVLP